MDNLLVHREVRQSSSRSGPGPNMSKPAKAPSDKALKALIEQYGCPVPLHEIRTRFLGNIATPDMTASPMEMVHALWGGELPVFDSMEAAQALINGLIRGLWNELTSHQERTQPFRLTRSPMDSSVEKPRAIGSHPPSGVEWIPGRTVQRQ